MTLGPVLKAKLARYIQNYELEDMKEDEAFELFVNSNILSQQYPGAFTADNELLKKTSVGGGNDLGLDGVSISLNGRMVRSKEEIDDVLSVCKKGRFEFTFIQSKNREKFDLGEFTKYTTGVLDFLNDKINSPVNNDVSYWHDIYNYIMSNEIIIKWECSPSIHFVYVTLGVWDNNAHIIGNAENTTTILKQNYSFEEITFRYIDAQLLTDIINGNENYYSTVLEVVDSMPLPQVNRVDNSSVIMCKVDELLKLLTDNGVLRRNLFEDNVRDYQGDTTINQEIRSTLENNAQDFVLLNNGITIVCDEMHEGNRKVSLKNPQIVNGCQTCNILFRCARDNIDLSDAYAVIKVIASDDGNIVNSIIKGTNRQNIVYDESFEVTRDFHKLLEDFFAEIQIDKYDKILYERRSKQYEDNPLVKPYQKANFRILIQSFVSLFLYKVEEGHHHEARLLNDYKEKIFLDHQSFMPYYLSVFLYTQVERLLKKRIVNKEYYTYKLQIMLILKEMIGGHSGDFNKKKEIENYCKSFIKSLEEKGSLDADLIRACKKFESIRGKWVKTKGESYKYNIKDNSEFTKFLLSIIYEKDTIVMDESNPIECGRVIDIKTDKNGDYYGFIRHSPDNIFFHEKNNPDINMSYIGKNVFYEVVDQADDKRYGINVRITDE